MTNKAIFILEEKGGEVCLTLDLRATARNSKSGRLANTIYGLAVQQAWIDQLPACYRHQQSNTIH